MVPYNMAELLKKRVGRKRQVSQGMQEMIAARGSAFVGYDEPVMPTANTRERFA